MKRIFAVALALITSTALAFGPNSASGSLTVQNANSNTGACTGSSCVSIDISFNSGGTIFQPVWAVYDTVTLQVTGTWSGTITTQCSQDEGATWFNFPVYVMPSTAGTTLVSLPVTSITANGNWYFDTGGCTTVRAVMSTYSSGTAVLVLEKQQAEAAVAIDALPLVTDSQQRLVLGSSSGATYNVTTLEAVGTSAKALFSIEGPDGGFVGQQRAYLRELDVCLDPAALQTTAGPRKLVLYATTAQTTGGSQVTPVALDPTSAGYSGPLPFTGAITTTPAIGSVAEAQAVDEFTIYMPASAATTNPWACVYRTYDGTRGLQPIAFGGNNGGLAGFADAGLALGDLTGGAGGTGNYVITAKVSAEPK